MHNLQSLLARISLAQKDFQNVLIQLQERGGITKTDYIRYLSMQFHLTNGVQRHFLIASSHPDLAQRRQLRKFLVNFANEEELHYELALKDIQNLKASPEKIMFSTELWWSYFNSIVYDSPFIRLGAACILENIAEPSKDLIQKLLSNCSFLNQSNTRFFVIHQHGEALPHGKEILKALESANLESHHWDQLVQGATKGHYLYLMMAKEALQIESPMSNKEAA